MQSSKVPLEASGPTPKLRHKSPHPDKKKIEKKKRSKRGSRDISDSDDSDEDYESYNGSQTSNTQSPGKDKTAKSRKSKEWQIIEGLKNGERYEQKPVRFSGFLLKRRKWPLKGWHKRYFVMDGGILNYAKTPSEIQKGKYHGTVDLALSFLVYKASSRRIDLDAEDSVYHLKAKGDKWFEEWICNFRSHRLYRQHELQFGTKDTPKLTEIQPIDDMADPETVGEIGGIPRKSSFKKMERANSLKSRISAIGVGRLSAWCMDIAGIEHCNKDLLNAQNKIFNLSKTLDELKSMPMVNFVDTNIETIDVEAAAPAKKDKRKFSLMKSRHKKSDSQSSLGSNDSNSSKASAGPNQGLSSSGSSTLKNQKPSPRQRRLTLPELGLLAPPAFAISSAIASSSSKDRITGSASNPNLMTMDSEYWRARPNSCPDSSVTHLSQQIQELKLREEFITCAKDVHDTLKSLVHTISTEKDRLKLAQQEDGGMLHSTPSYVLNLRQQLNEMQRHNAELTSRLARIHKESSLDDVLIPSNDMRMQTLVSSLSLESTASEYYDTFEDNMTPRMDLDESERDSSSSEEGAEEDESGSELTEGSDIEMIYADETLQTSSDSFIMKQPIDSTTGRRSALPAPQPVADVNLFSLLRRNIGKDLSKISMPVTLNEPLSMLQLMCEEMEYSDLLDRANEIKDPYEQMVYVAAFAVSAYACTYYRAGTKPFNPILGETYDVEREDMGWKFVAEQVSHHPPISASHCESNTFVYWQDSRVKTKFWGKSMEIHPHGTSHLSLKSSNDLYAWNKVTSCVHNILHGTRWVDHYGEIDIRCSNGCSAKITFTKATMWSNKRHEVHGQVCDENGRVVHNLFGKWTEGLHCGNSGQGRIIWRPGAMPEDNDLYYGFTRFAIELNELTPQLRSTLPHTDSRFRPDQRMLEEGDVDGAEEEKRRVENLQREARKAREEKRIEYHPLWFRKNNVKGSDQYEFNEKYWTVKRETGFSKVKLPQLW